MEPFGVRLPEFEGPLDLLLHLVRKERLDIRTVSVSMVVHQYMEYLRRMPPTDLGLLAEYLLMAATLLYLKSKALLPQAEDREEVEELEQDLAQRLIRYEAFALAREWLAERPMLDREVFARPSLPPVAGREEEIEADLGALLEAARRILKSSKAGRVPRPPEGFDLKKRMSELVARLKGSGRLKMEGRREWIPLFLAA
ncbi:MAG: hypothetical protein DRG31_06740, partial [Deltaproteobacteria bacterium]